MPIKKAQGFLNQHSLPKICVSFPVWQLPRHLLAAPACGWAETTLASSISLLLQAKLWLWREPGNPTASLTSHNELLTSHFFAPYCKSMWQPRFFFFLFTNMHRASARSCLGTDTRFIMAVRICNFSFCFMRSGNITCTDVFHFPSWKPSHLSTTGWGSHDFATYHVKHSARGQVPNPTFSFCSCPLATVN